MFDWGVAGRELSDEDGDSEDEQGVFVFVTHLCLLSLASVLTTFFLFPPMLFPLASLELMVTGERQYEQVARIRSFFMLTCSPFPDSAPFTSPLSDYATP